MKKLSKVIGKAPLFVSFSKILLTCWGSHGIVVPQLWGIVCAPHQLESERVGAPPGRGQSQARCTRLQIPESPESGPLTQ